MAEAEMLRTFNCGIGMLLYVERTRVDEVAAALAAVDQPATVVGEVVVRQPGMPEVLVAQL
ncbi:MAG: AIR synthase-related protein [Nannocystaceae bacterium]